GYRRSRVWRERARHLWHCRRDHEPRIGQRRSRARRAQGRPSWWGIAGRHLTLSALESALEPSTRAVACCATLVTTLRSTFEQQGRARAASLCSTALSCASPLQLTC